MLFGRGNDLFQKVGDALPIVIMGYSAFVSHRNILPIIFQLERIAGRASASSGLAVPAIRDHLTVIGNNFHTDLRRLPNVADNDVNLTIPFGPLTELVDVMGVHADCFKDNAVFVAVVLHPLQLIWIPGALWVLADLCSEVVHSVTQVIFEILLGCDVASDNVVVVAAYMHQGVLPGFLRRRKVVPGDISGGNPHPNKRATELSSIDHAAPT